jgi:hypothetical protein
MSEYRGTDWPADKSDEIGPEGGQGRGQRRFIREIELTEGQSGRCAVDEEIMPFDRGADRRGYDRLAQLSAVLGCGQRLVYCCRRYQSSPPIRLLAFLLTNPPLLRAPHIVALPGQRKTAPPPHDTR